MSSSLPTSQAATMIANNETRPPAHHLGRSQSTINADNAAIKFFDTYRRVKQNKGGIAEMEYIEIEGDNLQNTIADLVAFASEVTVVTSYHHNLLLTLTSPSTLLLQQF